MPLFTKETTAVIYGMQAAAIQTRNRGEPTVPPSFPAILTPSLENNLEMN